MEGLVLREILWQITQLVSIRLNKVCPFMFLWRAPELSCKYQLSNRIFHFRPNTRQALCTKLTHVHKHRTKAIQMLDFQKTFSFLTVQSCCGYRFKMSKNEWVHLVVRCTRFHYVLRAHALTTDACLVGIYCSFESALTACSHSTGR